MLSNGTKLGPYVIESPAGAGGMGEVYKAKDTRLDRTVAIKVLPAHLASNTEFRQRFEREAKTISSLNHPNICSLYDVGRQDGIDFLVMEYLEGEPLSRPLEKGPIPTSDLLKFAIQISDALDKAHKQGLVHRDLKPANIVLTKHGAKLLDFGLAKWQVSEDAKGLTAITRTSSPLTGEGTILGTFQYMSPEQLEGKEADARSDLFSFGVVLYEMATDKRPFEGKSQASLIAAIMREEPRPISVLQPMTPPALERVVTQCLAKEPDDRWQSAGDLKRALQWTVEGGSRVGIPIAVSVHRKFRERTLWGAVAVLAVALIVIGWMHFGTPRPTTKVTRLVIPSSPGSTFAYCPRISPDGSMVAFIADDSTKQVGIYVRPLNSLDAHLLVRGKSDVSRPFWAPDSKQLAYFENGHLKKVTVAGGLSQLICEAPHGSDGSWGRNGVIIFDGNLIGDSIRQVPAAGGSVTAATRIDHNHREAGHGWPYFLPDGEHFLYLVNTDSTQEQASLRVGSIHSMAAETLATVSSAVAYANGHLIYLQKDLLVAQPFDPNKRRLTGEPVPLSGNVAWGDNQLALFSVSNEGTLIYERWLAGGQNVIDAVNRHGDSLVQIGPPGRYYDFSLSPDNSRLAYSYPSESRNGADIWVRDIKRDVASRLTFGQGVNAWPIWNNDGTKVLFTTSRGSSRWSEMQHNANGTGSDETVCAFDTIDVAATSMSRDGSVIVLENGSGTISICLYNTLTKTAGPVLRKQFSERRGAISPDGKLLAYESFETGNPEVYIRELTADGGKWQISTAHGRCPRWRADGRELYYIVPQDFSFMAVPLSYDKSLEIGTPVKLFSHQFVFSSSDSYCPYSPTTDGKRFYILSSVHQGSVSDLVVVQNWPEELKK